MSFLRRNLLSVMLLPVLSSSAMAQADKPVREYALTLGADASRMWYGDGSSLNSLNANGSWLFLNEHFHVGPAVNFSRSYSDYFNSTGYGLGLMGRWTLENVQTADRTPFVELTAGMRKTKSSDWDDAMTMTSIGVGYEIFLNSFVSLAPSIYYSKSWTETEFDDSLEFIEDQSHAQTAARLHLGLNVYL